MALPWARAVARLGARATSSAVAGVGRAQGRARSGSSESGSALKPPAPPAAPPTHPTPPTAASPPATGLAARAAAADPAVLAKARRLALPVGLAAGAFGSLVGVGGGTLIVPFIAGACATIPQRLVAGSSLAAVLATAAAAAPAYAGAGAVDVPSAAAVCGGALLAARAGARAAATARPRALRAALGWFLLVAAVTVPTKALLLKRGQEERENGVVGGGGAVAAATPPPPTTTHSPARLAFLAAVGAAAGFASGLLGVGGGVLVTPALALWGGVPHAAAVGTSLAAMAPPAGLALASHAAAGNVDWRLAAGGGGGGGVGWSRGGARAPDPSSLFLSRPRRRQLDRVRPRLPRRGASATRRPGGRVRGGHGRAGRALAARGAPPRAVTESRGGRVRSAVLLHSKQKSMVNVQHGSVAGAGKGGWASAAPTASPDSLSLSPSSRHPTAHNSTRPTSYSSPDARQGDPNVSHGPDRPRPRSASSASANAGPPPRASMAGRANWKKSLRATSHRAACQRHRAGTGAAVKTNASPPP